MKKKLVLVAFMFAAIFTLVACDTGGKTELASPTELEISEEYVISFNEVENAVGYQAKLVFGSSFLFEVETGDDLSNRFTSVGIYKISIRALGGDSYKNSPYTTEVQVEVKEPEKPEVVISTTSVTPSCLEGGTFDLTTLFTIKVGTEDVTVTSAMLSHSVNFNEVGTYNVVCSYEQDGKSGTKTVAFSVLPDRLNDFLDSLDVFNGAKSYTLTHSAITSSGNVRTVVSYDIENGLTSFSYSEEETIYLVEDDPSYYVYLDPAYEIWSSEIRTTENEIEFGGYLVSFALNIEELLSLEAIAYDEANDVYIITDEAIAGLVFGNVNVKRIEAEVINGNLYSIKGIISDTDSISITYTRFNNTEVDVPAVQGFETLIPGFEYESDVEGDSDLNLLLSALQFDFNLGNYMTFFNVHYMNINDRFINSYYQQFEYEKGIEKFFFTEEGDGELSRSIFVYLESIDAYVEFYINEEGYIYPFPSDAATVEEYFLDFGLNDVAFELAELLVPEDGFFVPEVGDEYMIFSYLFGEVRNSIEDIVTVNYLKFRVENGQLAGIFAQVLVESAENGVEVYTIDTYFGYYGEIVLEDYATLDLPATEIAFIDLEVNAKETTLWISNGTIEEKYVITSAGGNAKIETPDGLVYYVYQEPGYISYEIYYVDPETGLWTMSPIYMNAQGEWVYDIAFPIPTAVFSFWVQDEEGYILDVPYFLREEGTPGKYKLVEEGLEYAFMTYFNGYTYYNGAHILLEYGNVIEGYVTITDVKISQMVFKYQHGAEVLTFTLDIIEGDYFRFPEEGVKATLDQEEKDLIDSIGELDFSNYYLYYAFYENYEVAMYEEYQISLEALMYYFESGSGAIEAYFVLDSGSVIEVLDGRGLAYTQEEIDDILDYFMPKTLAFITSDMFDNVRYDDGVPAFNVKDEYMELFISTLFGDYGYSNWDFMFLEMFVEEGDIYFIGSTFDGTLVELGFGGFGVTVVEIPVFMTIQEALELDYSLCEVVVYVENATEVLVDEEYYTSISFDFSILTATDFEMFEEDMILQTFEEEFVMLLLSIFEDLFASDPLYAGLDFASDLEFGQIVIEDNAVYNVWFYGEIFFIDIFILLM